MRGTALAHHRQAIAASFYESLYQEVNEGYTAGQALLTELLNKEDSQC